MWRRFKNIFLSFRTYAELSPDVRVRQRVNRCLRSRPLLSADEWFEKFWRHRNVSKPIADFVYTQMKHYSGLEFSRVQPNDRLDDDLHLSLTCWFDWELSLCEDFLNDFGVDMGDCFDLQNLETVEDLVVCLNHYRLSINPL